MKEDASKALGNGAFCEDLQRKIGIHFGYLINRGFEIKINSITVKSETLRLFMGSADKDVINPFDYVAFYNKVRIRVIVGFNRSLPRSEELEEEEEAPRVRENAGISVLCNDRVILHNDTTFRTGWGTRTVPKFHNRHSPYDRCRSPRLGDFGLPSNTGRRPRRKRRSA